MGKHSLMTLFLSFDLFMILRPTLMSKDLGILCIDRIESKKASSREVVEWSICRDILDQRLGSPLATFSKFTLISDNRSSKITVQRLFELN